MSLATTLKKTVKLQGTEAYEYPTKNNPHTQTVYHINDHETAFNAVKLVHQQPLPKTTMVGEASVSRGAVDDGNM